jgi:hypothetical protein
LSLSRETTLLIRTLSLQKGWPYKKTNVPILITKPILDLVFHRDLNALIATLSKTGSPVNRLNVPNSIRNVPTPAVHVTVVSPLGTPCFRLTVPYGIPVCVSKAVKITYNN